MVARFVGRCFATVALSLGGCFATTAWSFAQETIAFFLSQAQWQV
jgi:hypothetical protein